MDLNLEEGTDSKKKIEVLSKIDELKVIANNHYLMGKYDEAIKVAEHIMDIAEEAKLYSVVREEGEHIASLYKQAKADHKFIIVRDDFEGLREDYEKLLAQDKIADAHDLLQTFEQYYKKDMNLNSFKRVKELFLKDEKLWTEFHTKQLNIIRQLEPLEIQFNSYLNTNNLLLAGETLEKAKKLLARLKDINLLKKWEKTQAMFLELKKKYDLDEGVEKNLKEVSNLTENYEFDKAKNILKSNIDLLHKSNFSDYSQKLEAKLKYVVDAESKYLKLEEDIQELERIINQNLTQNQFKEAIDNINQIIKISRFIGKTNSLDQYTKYIDILEEKIKISSQIEDTSYVVKKLNVQGIEALKNEDYIVSLEIYKRIVDLIQRINRS
ncbi:MAG: hypothetical protein HWN80_13900 [Candidatus Lokiarchaeota archaeon]|nr:hypothetical protein [Candidatus Lokiarchaeota archaeon]